MLDRILALDDFSGFMEAEEIHGHVPVVARSGLLGVQAHQVPLGNTTQEADRLFGIFLLHPFEVRNETLRSIGHRGVLLSLFGTHVFLYDQCRVARVGG